MAPREPEGGHPLHVERAGRGRPIVLLHGWSMSSRAFGPLLEQLARHYRVLVPDLRGHGRSQAPATGYAIEDHARDVAALLEREEATGAVLVGWSMGAQVALEAFPASRPRLAALALLSGTPRFTRSGDWAHGLAESSVRALAARFERRPGRTLERFFEGMFVPGELDAARVAELARTVLAGAPPPAHAAARAGLEAFVSADQRARVDEVAVPTLVLHGELDPICLPGAARWTATRIGGARLLPLRGLGHAPHLSRPALVSDLLLGFLAEALPS